MRCVNEIKLQFPSKSVNEGYARVAAAALIAQLDPTFDELADIKTAVSEAVTNCIVHAYAGASGKIMMQVRLFDDNRVVIIIKDWGRGIDDIKKAMEPCYTTSAEEERSGMGFTIMETFMDKLRVTSKPGRGTRVVMEKYISNKNI
ncbi:MAG: anti-sigma F factor [Bacillota bacterium]|nr:anti-sigma F factor [Bacillota bacterium]